MNEPLEKPSTNLIQVELTVDINAESQPAAFTAIYQKLNELPGVCRIRFSEPKPPIVIYSKWHTPNREQHLQFWKGQDWKNKNSEEIAAITGKSPALVTRYRRKLFGSHSPLVARKTNLARIVNQYALVDWTLQDAVIARQTGRSRQYISQIRKRLKKPPCSQFQPNKRTIVPKFKEIAAKMLENKSAVESKMLWELREQFNVHDGTIRAALNEAGISFNKALRHPWEKMNWDLPSSDLEEIWSLPANTAHTARTDYRFHKPKWRYQRYRTTRTSVLEWSAAFEAEKLKAFTHTPPSRSPADSPNAWDCHSRGQSPV